MLADGELPRYLDDDPRRIAEEFHRELSGLPDEDEEIVNVYTDELSFDLVSPKLPPAKAGRFLLLLYIAIQCVMLFFSFAGYHNRRKGNNKAENTVKRTD
jgi:hypothetical protein